MADKADILPVPSRDRLPRAANIRFRVDPRDVPAEKAARRLHLTVADFELKLPKLLERGFPPPDVTTGMFDLRAIDEWMTSRHNPLPTPGLMAEVPRATLQRSSPNAGLAMGHDKIRYLLFSKRGPGAGVRPRPCATPATAP